ELVFVGGFTPERAEWFRHLLDHDLALWGPNWHKAVSLDSRFARAIRGRPLFGEDYSKAYAAADIGLNIVQKTTDGHNMRTFEAMAAGGFVMSNRTRELGELFR